MKDPWLFHLYNNYVRLLKKHCHVVKKQNVVVLILTIYPSSGVTSHGASSTSVSSTSSELKNPSWDTSPKYGFTTQIVPNQDGSFPCPNQPSTHQIQKTCRCLTLLNWAVVTCSIPENWSFSRKLLGFGIRLMKHWLGEGWQADNPEMFS